MRSEDEKKRILFAGGGTAGHLMPAINIAREMTLLNKEIIPNFIGKKGGMEKEIVRQYGFEIIEIDVIGMKRTIAGVFKFAIKWLTANRQAMDVIGKTAPLAVVGTGGYISAPVVRAAFKRKIPVFLQEQNSLPGLATRTLSRYAVTIFTAYESAAKYLSRASCKLSGNPIRSDITLADRADSYRLFELDPAKHTLLVLGGSSGAKGVNSAILNLVKENHIPDGWQTIWQTGKNDFDHIKSSIAGIDSEIKLFEFINDMPAAYAVADLIISRAGAMALSEIAAVGLPAVLIPYPHATGDHQTLNARYLKDSGAAVVIPENELGGKLSNIIGELFNDEKKRRLMSEKALGFGKPDAAREIAREILETISEI